MKKEPITIKKNPIILIASLIFFLTIISNVGIVNKTILSLINGLIAVLQCLGPYINEKYKINEKIMKIGIYLCFIFSAIILSYNYIETNNTDKIVHQETKQILNKKTEVTNKEIETINKEKFTTQLETESTTEKTLQESENEPNNNIEEANKIEVNKKYRGKLSSEEDIDYYEFELKKAGKVSIKFQHSKIDSENPFWMVYLIGNKNDDEIIRFNSTGGKASYQSGAARLPKGKYYIKIVPDYYSDKSYTFKINFKEETDLYEKEENNQTDIANEINVNTKYVGNLQTEEDVDYYKFKITEKGKINISFEHDKIDNESTLWEVCLLDGLNDYTIINMDSNGKDAILQSDNARIPPGEYYIKINSYYYSNKDYNFTVNFTAESEQFESENNNEFDSANQIEFNKKYIGNIQQEDVDYYYFSVEENRNITLEFEHDMIDNDSAYWEISILSGKSNEDIIHIYAKGLETPVLETSESVEPGIYYIKVEPSNYNNSDYSILIR